MKIERQVQDLSDWCHLCYHYKWHNSERVNGA